MADQHDYDDLETDYLEEETESGFLSLMSVVIAFIAVAVFIVLAWYAYQTGTETTRPLEEMEVVYPEEGAIREAPEDPGGWQFPNKDRSMYNIISGEESEVKVEKILPPPEDPVARPEAQTEMWIRDRLEERVEIAKTEAEKQLEKVKQQRQQMAEEQEAAPKPKPEVEKEAETASEPVSPKNQAEAEQEAVKEKTVQPKPEPVAQAPEVKAEQPAAEPKKPKAVESKPEKTIQSAGLTPNRLQLGAFRSQEEAKRFWQKLLNQYPELIRKKAMHIERADLKEKGVYYRVQLYPFASKDEAKALCAKLSAKGQSCFPVTR